MNAVVALLLGIVVALVGYYLYARYIDGKVFKVDEKKATPAKMYMDGVDFVPTSRHVLFGYQFKSVAALGPVLGPIIALKWGWLPGLLWVLLGAFFIGWVQDYTSAMIGLRNDGKSPSELSYTLISPRSRVILLSFMYFYLLLIIAAFGSIVGGMLQKTPSVPFAIIALTAVGVLAGFLIYKKRMDILLVTIIMVVLSLAGIWAGTALKIGGTLWFWVAFTLAFSFVGAVLPIWSYTQPINYISFYLVALGMLGGFIGIIVGRPNFTAPVFTTFKVGPDYLWPILFVTVACGAISGWHSLVSTCGTARQLERETDARYVAGGSMFLEMLLALLALIVACAAFPNFQAYQAKIAEAGPAGVFSFGLARFLSRLGLPLEFATAFAGAMLAILAITIMQLVVRFMRIATAEIAGEKAPVLRNPYVGALIAVLLAFALVRTGTWQYIWVLFGGSNQLMAALALMLVSVWLVRDGKKCAFTFYPMLFMLVTTIAALALTAYSLIDKAFKIQAGTVKPPAGQTVGMAVGGNIVSGLIAAFLIVAAIILAVDGFRALARLTRKAPVAAGAAKQA